MTPPWEDLKDLGVSIVGHRLFCSTRLLTYARTRTANRYPDSLAVAVAVPVKEHRRRAPPSHVMFSDRWLNRAVGALDREDLGERRIGSASSSTG